MKLTLLLEKLASHTHNNLLIEEIISCQPEIIQQAFRTNNAFLLKKQLGNVENLADRTTIFQLY